MAYDIMLCCFCGDQIEIRAPDPCRVIVVTSEQKDQFWACHSACFKEKLAKEPPIFEPGHF